MGLLFLTEWKIKKIHGSSHHQPDMGWKSIEIYGKSLEKSRTHHHIPHDIMKGQDWQKFGSFPPANLCCGKSTAKMSIIFRKPSIFIASAASATVEIFQVSHTLLRPSDVD